MSTHTSTRDHTQFNILFILGEWSLQENISMCRSMLIPWDISMGIFSE